VGKGSDSEITNRIVGGTGSFLGKKSVGRSLLDKRRDQVTIREKT